MKKQSIFLMSLCTVISSSMMNASKPKKPNPNNPNLYKARRNGLSSSMIMPSQAAAITIDPLLSQASKQPISTTQTIAAVALLEPQAASSVPASQQAASSSAAPKKPFTGFLSTRYRPGSYLYNWWYTPTYKRAITEAESFDPEKQTWQNDQEAETFIATALQSFKKHNVPTELKHFLVIAKNKSIPLPPLDEIQTWLRELHKNNENQKKIAGDCLSQIGVITKQTENNSL
ncbi:MAG: hypothetical protein P4L31_06260 [Candidatus Babeliales bacterium]|nr:hypothetical protein [Candidatus Babeliales bacterium]